MVNNENNNVYYSYSGPFKKGIDVATHYGFDLIKPIRASAEIKQNIRTRPKFLQERYVDPVHKTAMYFSYAEPLNKNNAPVMLCNTRSAKSKDGGGINLHIFGSSKSIAEALTIKTALTILDEYGKKQLMVDINSLGDRATHKIFLRDFSNHYRKHAGVIGECCRKKIKDDVALLTECNEETCLQVKNDAPKSVGYLTETGISHFKNVLEYMESMDMPYRINPDLIGENPDLGTQTTFVITETVKKYNNEEKIIVARGERYNRCLHSGQSKKIIPTVCIMLDLPGGRTENYKVLKNNKVLNPEFYLIHLGVEAKRKSLYVIETLRRQKIHISQSLVHDGLSKQIKRAETLEVPYVVIMGLKEVKENSVIVRNMNTYSQTTIPVDNLLKYLRKISARV
jgi:histidyl-tRNA synthetase